MKLKNMRTAFDCQIFSIQEYGGVSCYLYELMQNLVKIQNQGISVSAVSPLYFNQYLKQTTNTCKTHGYSIKRISKTGPLVRAINFPLSKFILYKMQPDIVHETYYSRISAAPKTCRLVLTVHDMIHELFPENFSTLNSVHRRKKLAVARADHIICVSQQTRQDLIRLMGVDSKKTSVVYHGVSLRKTSRLKIIQLPERPYIFYVGSRLGYKNFNMLLKAYASSSKINKNYALFCFGGGLFTKYEMELMTKLGLTDNQVQQVSGSDELLAGFYQHASAFIYPSLYEGFGMPPLEAMVFDCPVACSDLEVTREIVGDAGLYFDPTDMDDIQNTIEKLLSDTELRKSLTIAGRNRVKKFSWERCAAETMAVYQKVLG